MIWAAFIDMCVCVCPHYAPETDHCTPDSTSHAPKHTQTQAQKCSPRASHCPRALQIALFSKFPAYTALHANFPFHMHDSHVQKFSRWYNQQKKTQQFNTACIILLRWYQPTLECVAHESCSYYGQNGRGRPANRSFIPAHQTEYANKLQL